MDFKEKKGHERRRYTRLDHIFPVEFRFHNEAGEPVSSWYQAFTQDVSSGGLCLLVNHLEFGDTKYLADRNMVLHLRINIPLGAKAVEAKARVSWQKTMRTEPTLQYALGVSYDSIEESGNRRILKYVHGRKLLKAAALTFSIFLSVGLVTAGFYNARLRYENEKLLVSVSENLSRQKSLKQGSDALLAQIEEMRFLLSQSERKIEMLQRRLDLAGREDQRTVAALRGSLDFMKRYQEKVKGALEELVAKKTKVDQDANARFEEASLLEKRIRDKLFRWLVTHQNVNTGLVASFEGDRDVSDWAFTYDQALAAIVFTNAHDFSRAAQVLDFYLKAAKSDQGAFFNAYYASSGDASEYVAHAGPNIWLGLAICQYAHASGDKKYLPIALDISRWLDKIRDEEGGLRGGQEFSWYSTEHNLDAYAFYTILARLTRDETFHQNALRTLEWLNKNAYSRLTGSLVKRGKGDSTIATDTYAWSVTAIGPETLKDGGMDPDAIMDFAIANCSVSAEYRRPDGTVSRVKGFDFAKPQNLARGGVVSCEWSAQMVLAIKIMEEYHRGLGNLDQAAEYGDWAKEYTSELSKMIITSPSPVGQGDFCLPYASHELADTGHGWRTPRGDRTGSVAATAYAILAIDGVNPLRLKES